ncbi:unnamed protein product [Discosporangium mesarthrocarpum]
MYTEEGLLAARGRHIKYLPMGVAWDLTGTIPGLFPIAARLFDWRHNLWARDPERTLVRAGSGGGRGEGVRGGGSFI